MSYRTAAIVAAVWLGGVAAGPPVAAQPFKKTVYEGVDTSAIQGFGVALVLGDLQGGASPESLPVGAKKALADLRDFLPYKSYRLLDAQWIMCCGEARGGGIAGRLRGLDEQSYGFAVQVIGVSGSRLSLRFSLRDDTFKKGPAKYGDDVAVEIVSKQQQQEKALLEALLEEERRRPNPKASVIQDLEIRLGKIKAGADDKPKTVPIPPKGSMIDSTFSMDVGETVVIGTSGLKGDKALIALLTAARRSPSTSTAPGEKR